MPSHVETLIPPARRYDAATMFLSTLPIGEPELMRASAFRRHLAEEARAEGDRIASQLSTLSPSLLLDLMRFEQDGRGGGLLEVLAAGIRHARRLLLHLQHRDRVLPLTIFPVEQLVHCPLPLPALLALPLDELEVLHVEPAALRPPGDRMHALVGAPAQYHPLPVLIWEIALRGARSELLPEIAGRVAYRVSPGAQLRRLALAGTLADAVARLQRQATPARDIARWPGFDDERARRLLNALYLQAALIVSRTHPAATNDG
jgi:hypothetical protein